VAEPLGRFGVLGPLTVERDGQPVRIPSGHQRSLLALMLMNAGVALSRDRLIDELWGEQPPSSAVSAIHVHLSKLRQLLGDLMVRDSAGYALQSNAIELDVSQFDVLVEQATSDPDRAGLLLREALALVRGDPLADVACEGSIAVWRRSLEEKRLHALLLRVDADLVAGAAGELVAELERLVSAHPFEERLRGQLMVALYRSGRQADALDAFQQARKLFATELGLDPSEELARLQTRILDRDPALMASPSAAVADPPAKPSSNLPRPLTRLVGRSRELTALKRLLADPDARLVTLVGPGGVGKTRLLLELARALEPEYRDGAVLVQLERLTDPALVAAEIAAALARRDGTDGAGADGLVRHLRDRELLLVVDNFEHLQPAGALMAELLEHAPSIRVLISSRTALRIRGEQLFRVEPLELPATNGDAEIAHSPAVQLFVQLALSADRNLVIDAAVNRTVAAICTALDGLPLAIELAASRCRSLSPAEIAEQLSRPLSIGEHALRDLPERQQTLRATIAWSYELLSPGAREALRAAGAFLGGFTPAALKAVLARSPAANLEELQDASLVRYLGDARRYELLELVRAFALDELRGAGEEASVRERHRRYYAELIEPVGAEFDAGAAAGELTEPIWVDHANLRAAYATALEDQDPESAVALAMGMRPLWLAGNLRQESDEVAERLLGHVPIAAQQELALLRILAGTEERGDKWQRRFADRAAELGDQDSLGIATTQLFAVAMNSRDVKEMRRLRPVLLGLLEPGTSPRVLGWVHYSLFADAYVHGRFQSAYEHACLSVERAEETGHEYMLACAADARLLARSAVEGKISQPDLAAMLDLARRHGIHSIAVGSIWFAARYAASIEPEIAGRWLAIAERILTELDQNLWPEDVLREETMRVLGIADLAPLMARTPPLDAGAALAEASAWVATRDPGESSPREVATRSRKRQGTSKT
jgi:predicted ATPase/DNA-binding SARP family transcriptional activator